MKLGTEVCTEVGLGPGHIVLDEDPAPLPQRDTAPNFRPLSIVAKRLLILATDEHLFYDNMKIRATIIVSLLLGCFEKKGFVSICA